MVQRYDCRGAVVTHEAGPFVKYEDYAALKKERNRLKAHLDALAYSVLNSPLSTETEELAKEVFGV